MSDLKALITDIGRASVKDGDGFRTTVFFKGCPLKCVWCHNPECISFKSETLFYPEKCIGCGKCDSGCFSGARVVCGTEMTAEEIILPILADKPYYGDHGGVTFSGGEALAQPEILSEIIKLCRLHSVNTAIETSLYLFNETILKSLDFVMADFKIWDDGLHKKYTGVSNEVIKENFKRLDCLGVPFIVRTPLIPTITDNRENIAAIRDFINKFKNIIGYEVLEYNPLGNSKLVAMGREPIKFSKEQTPVKELIKYADIRR